MKTLGLILLGAFLVEFSSVWSVQAQNYSPRQLTRRVAPQPTPTPPPVQANPPQQQTPPPTAAVRPAPAHPMPAPAMVRVPPPVDPVKAKAAREESVRKAIEFQKKRAAEGSESAQYELGMRYLRGDGVEKDEATGRKWLEESSKNGFGPATKKLESLLAPAETPKKEPK